MSALRELLAALSDEELEDRLTSVHMDGFCSGVASAVMTILMNQPQPPAREEVHARADHLAQYLANGIRHDRLSFEEIRNQVRERLAGEDSGSFSYLLPGDQS